MADLDESARWKLPLLAVNQMQKDVTHNEALAMIDFLLSPIVVDGPIDVPPTAPLAGQCWLIGGSPSGAWSGKAGQIAGWTDGGWRWITPAIGMALRSSDGRWLCHGASGWHAPADPVLPSGGAVIDSEARTALNALIVALRAQGVLAPAA